MCDCLKETQKRGEEWRKCRCLITFCAAASDINCCFARLSTEFDAYSAWESLFTNTTKHVDFGVTGQQTSGQWTPRKQLRINTVWGTTGLIYKQTAYHNRLNSAPDNCSRGRRGDNYHDTIAYQVNRYLCAAKSSVRR